MLKELVENTSIADILTLISILIAVYHYIKDKRRENKYATMMAYQDLQNKVFDELNRWSPLEIKEATQNRTSDAYKTLGEHLSRIEFFCVGINQKIYDFDTFYAIAHGYFDKGGMLYQRLYPILEKKLEGASEDHYQNIHKVWKEMEEKSQR